MQHFERVVGTVVALVLMLVVVACAPMPVANDGAAQGDDDSAVEEMATEAPVAEVDEAEEAVADGETVTFAIDASQSSVRFILDEDLRGDPTTVVGEGNGVSGELMVNVDNPAETTIGTITIDARSLETDNGMRNRAIGRFVLQSNDDANQYIVFTPTSIEGIPEDVAVGNEMSFNVVGDLTIRDVTQPVTFALTVLPESTTMLRGSGQAEVLRSDFGLQIPSVPGVANVTDEVQLEIDFVATAE